MSHTLIDLGDRWWAAANGDDLGSEGFLSISNSFDWLKEEGNTKFWLIDPKLGKCGFIVCCWLMKDDASVEK